MKLLATGKAINQMATKISTQHIAVDTKQGAVCAESELSASYQVPDEVEDTTQMTRCIYMMLQ